MNKLWKKLDQLSTRCYEDMIQSNPTMDNWDEAFSVLVEITEEGRQRDSSFAQEMYQLEQSIEYQCDVTGWFEDYMDELEMCERYDRLQYVCEKVLQLFQWKEESPSDIKFRIAFAMAGQGKNEETLAFCEDWYKAEYDNIVAATSLIYAQTAVKDYQGAEAVVKKFITKDTVCSEENDIIYTAASHLYKVNGNKKEEKRINKAIKTYEKELEEYFLSLDEEDLDFDLNLDIPDEELPFK